MFLPRRPDRGVRQADRGSSWSKPELSTYLTAAGEKTNVVFAPGPSFYFGCAV
eukprot:SAG11_NODE_1780_length_4264_cov_3.335654_4_plen_52_part_01